ncbi:MAG: hypothetical protein ABR990_03830 [Terracidiphilus sp.]|jgi:hypothetical protein
MSLLNQESPRDIDDAARGEELTRGTTHVVWAGVAATLLVTVALGLYVLATQKPPVVSGEIVQVWAHPNHVVTSGMDANGYPMAKQSFDQVLVFARVKLRNQSKNPLILEDVLANIRQADGILSVSAGSSGQYEEVFLAYPELAALHSNPLSPRTTLEPGQSVEGNTFWIFRLSRQEWDARQDLNFTFRFQYQANLVLAPHTAVTAFPE